jgi:hypothetical protein
MVGVGMAKPEAYRIVGFASKPIVINYVPACLAIFFITSIIIY